MATPATKRPKRQSKKPKEKPLRGGNSNKPPDESPLIPHADHAETNGKPAQEPGKTYIDGVNVDKPIPFAPVVDQVVNRVANLLSAPPGDYGSPEALSKYDQETVVLTEESADKCNNAFSEWEKLHAQAAAAKKAWESTRVDHFSLIRERKAGRGKPPIPKPAVLYPDPEKTKGDGKLPVAPAPEDTSWKQTPLKELVEKDDLPDYIVAKLANAQRKDGRDQPPILTLGDLTDFQAPEKSGYTKKLTDIVGIGPGAAEKIEEATAAFWKRWGTDKPKAATEHPVIDDKEADEDEDDDDDQDAEGAEVPEQETDD
jgi:hypothetical protein